MAIIWRKKKPTTTKAIDLPAEAVRLPDGRWFIPLKARQPKQRPEAPQRPTFTPVEEFYGVDPLPKDAPDPLPFFRHGDPYSREEQARIDQFCPMTSAPPLTQLAQGGDQ